MRAAQREPDLVLFDVFLAPLGHEVRKLRCAAPRVLFLHPVEDAILDSLGANDVTQRIRPL